MQRRRVLLAGGDYTHQEQYARHFAADPRCVLVGVTDLPGISVSRHVANRALAERFHIAHLRYEEALVQPCDIVSVCVAMADRARVACDFAARGRHLYLDKPLAPGLAHAAAIAEAVGMAGVSSQLFSQVHTHWAQAARSAIRSGRLGPIAAVHMRMLIAKGPWGDVPDVARAERPTIEPIPPEPVKREMFDLGYYPVALLSWLLERPVRTVTAQTGNYFLAENFVADAEDFGTMLLEFEGGVVATVACGRIGWESHPGKGFVEVVLSGTETDERFAPDGAQLQVNTSARPFLPPGNPRDPMGMWDGTLTGMHWPETRPIELVVDPPTADIRAFLNALDRHQEPEITAAAGARHIAVLEAAYRSAASGRPEPVTDHTLQR